MKIAFVYRGFESIGIELLSACLKKTDFNVKLFYDPSLFGTFHVSNNILKKSFNSCNTLIKEIIDSESDLICFSVVSDDYRWACTLASRIKSVNKKTKIIFGGIHPTSMPEMVLAQSFVDFVCVGEAEEALVELAQALKDGQDTTVIRNVWAKKDGVIISNNLRPLIRNLDLLPFPDKELFYENCRGFSSRIYVIMTSRGCPYYCSYCYGSYTKVLYPNESKILRRRSVNNVIEELLIAKDKFKFRKVLFVDDVFTYDYKWLHEFLGEYKKKISFPFGCLMFPRLGNHMQETIDLLDDAGCKSVGMGVQSILEGQRRNILNRPGSNDELIPIIKAISKTKIFLYLDFILGLPYQDDSELCKTALFVNEFKPDAVATMWLRYYPKTELLERAKRDNLIPCEEIKRNEESYEYNPIAKQGGTFSKQLGKIGNLILIAHILPRKVLKFIIKHKLYRFLFPSRNYQYFTTWMMIAWNKIFHAKDGSLYFSAVGLLEYYLRSFLKRLKVGFTSK